MLTAASTARPAPCQPPAAGWRDGPHLMSLTPPASLAPLLSHPVAVFGGATSGLAARTLLTQLGARSEVFDERPDLPAAHAFGAPEAAAHRLVVFSPGFDARHPWLLTARAAGCTCLGELDFAALFWPGRVVAVTGTNGKTTLVEFLTHALLAEGEDVFGVGNIGFPFSRLITFRRDAGPDSIAICEVSSFQAETLQHVRPDAVLWTNFAEDHLERHPGLRAYFLAKWNLLARARPGAVFAGSSVQRYALEFGQKLPPAAGVASEGLAPEPRLNGTVFASYPQRENFALALAWWRHDGRAEAQLYAAARTFKSGRHRLARVRELRGVTFWNDSKATNFHAVEAALSTVPPPVHLIAGGRAKGGDLAAFVRRIAPRVRHLWLIGETAPALAALAAGQRVAHTVCPSLEEAVHGAFAAAQPGDHVLLSPAFASFDMFRSYADRGERFEKLVNHLGTTPTFQ